MPDSEWIDVEIDGRTVEVYAYANGTEYEVDASCVKNIGICPFIEALEAYSGRIKKTVEQDKPVRIDLLVKLDGQLAPWDKTVYCIAIYLRDSSTYKAEFPLFSGIGAQEHELRETLSPVMEGAGFTLSELEPSMHEHPLIETDGWHQWTCVLSDIPNNATFGDLLNLREGLSRTAFLPQASIASPYVALRLIQVGRAEALLGCPESEWLECKSFAYEFKDIHESLWKHELAEDVVQFANTERGGLLLIGFHTKRVAGVDTIDKITPVPTSDTRPQAYRDILRHRIHPPISGLDIEAFPWNGGQIVCLFVPPQRDVNQPYLVSGSIIQGRYIRSGITIVRREGDASIPITAEEIHSTLVAGRAFLRGH
jgi:hypothetical protein